MKSIMLVLSVFLSTSCMAQSLYFPPVSGNWDTTSATSLNWCQEGLDSLQQFLADKDTKGFIILKEGKIVVEWYFDSFVQDSLWYWASAGKSLTATLVGIAAQEGYLNLTDTTSQYLGNWTACSATDEQQITILNQLTMTSGLDDTYGDCTTPACLNCLAASGTRWAYHNAPYTLLTDVVESATGYNYNVYLNQKINQKIGAGILYIQVGSNRVAISKPRDMARFGLLTLAKGNWNGTQVYDSAYYHLMTNTSQSINPAYGYLWWLNGKNQYMLPTLQLTFNGKLVPNAPDDMFAALGKNDQKIYVVPSEKIVVVRVGHHSGNAQLALSSFDNELWAKINALNCTNSTSNFATANKIVKVYPNPATDLVRLESAAEIKKVSIYNAQGDCLYLSENISNQLDVSEYNEGLYVLRVWFEDGQVVSVKLLVH